MIYLTEKQILDLHDIMILNFGGLQGIRCKNLLSSCVESPKMTFGGNELYKSIELKASTYLFNIIKNHPFNDGNKRTALSSFLSFLNLNNYDMKKLPSKKRLEDFAIKLANEKISIEEVVFFIKIM